MSEILVNSLKTAAGVNTLSFDSTGDVLLATGKLGTVSGNTIQIDSDGVLIAPSVSVSSAITLPAGSIDSDMIGAGAVKASKIASGAVEASKIASGAVESAMTTPLGGRRNLIINGAMQISQRGTSFTGITSGSGTYTLDRYDVYFGSLGTWTVEQSTDAPNGFSNSLKCTATTADPSPAAGDYAGIVQYIEAQNLQYLGFGTADAKSLTMSFWVKSNKTGSGTFEIRQTDNSNKQVTPSYTINQADTWEHKVISIPADTAGLINNDNGVGFQLEWWLNSGSTYTGGTSQTTWSTAVLADRNAANLGVGSATNDYFAITGVQLEVGDTATPFEYRGYGEELLLCQRYYEKSYRPSITPGSTSYNGRVMLVTNAASGNYPGGCRFKVTKRAIPTVTLYHPNGSSGKTAQWNDNSEETTSVDEVAETGWGYCYMAGGTTGSAYTCHWTAEAEL